MNRWRFAIWASIICSNIYYRSSSQHCISLKPLIFYLIILLNSSVLSKWRNDLGTTLLMTDFSTDYGRPMKPFFNDISNCWANWPNRRNKFWGIFSLTISTHLGTVSLFSMISTILMFFLQKKLCFSSITQIYPKYDIGHEEFGN